MSDPVTRVWKPENGQYWEPGQNYYQSYAGIVAALNDQLVKGGQNPKDYPHNFAGIISAIKDLKIVSNADKQPGAESGNQPDGWVPSVPPESGNGEIYPPLEEGTLWFDERQGRLFIYSDGDFYQTNGGDGLTEVSDENNVPSAPVIGSTWFNTDQNSFWVWTNSGWTLIDGSGGTAVTTGESPLANPNPFSQLARLPDLGTQLVQKDYNEWVYSALESLESGANTVITIGDTPPPAPLVGALWFDSSGLDLSIWYEDADTAQWVPVSTPYNGTETVEAVDARLSAEIQTQSDRLTSTETELRGLFNSDSHRFRGMEVDITLMASRVTSLEDNPTDVSSFTTSAALTAVQTDLQTKITALENATPDLSAHATNDSLNALNTALQLLINARATPADVAAVQALIPDISAKVDGTFVTNAINNITTEYLPRTGGTLTGSFVLEKLDAAIASFDFSGESWYGRNALKLKANTSSTDDYTTFGVTDSLWEYSWDFDSDEDFCWKHDDVKVFSINKDGPACKALYLADFSTNTSSGRVLQNTIEVRSTLVKYQTAFEAMRQAVASSTDYASLKQGLTTALTSV